MELMTVYTWGAVVVVLYSLFWSFVLDRNKPPTTREFIVKFIARGLFLMFVFSVLVGFAYYALGLFETAPD